MAQPIGGYDDIFVNLNLTHFSVTQIIFSFFRWCGQIGDTLFIAVSAYFLCDSEKIKLKKPIRMIIDTWLFSVISLISASFFMVPSTREMIKAVMPVRYSLNWFVGCYIIYYLLHPLLNKAVKGLEQRTFKKIVIVLFILYSLLGSIQQEYYYTNLVGFICIHYFVTYYKTYCVNAKSYANNKETSGKIKRDILVIILAISAILIWICLLNFAGRYIGALSSRGLLACTYMNPAIIIIGFAALDIAVRAKPCEIKWVNTFTKYSLLIYLIHGNYFWLTYGKYALTAILYDRGVPQLGCVLIIIVLYTIVTPILSKVYCRISDKTLDKISIWGANKIIGN